MPKKLKTEKEVIRVDGKLKEIVTVSDDKGNVLHKIISPLMVEFKPKDFLQVIVGSTLLAIPVAYTEETWKLGESLPIYSILMVAFISLLFMSAFVYYNFYRKHLKDHIFDFIKRVLLTYLVSCFVVAVLLTIIHKAPWTTDWLLAMKRIILVSFPASMSASVADMIK